jgi:hypothetical protein
MVRLEEDRVYVPFKVVHWNERLAEFEGEHLSVGHSHEERPDQAWALSHPTGIEVAKRETGLREGLPYDWYDLPQVLAGGKLGDYAPVFAVGLHLGSDNAR